MTAQEAIAYIEHQGWSTTRLGLGRTQTLLEKLGNPQKKLKFVHVAGSNGKGSTCAMLERILRQAGYRTGLYISPYLQDFCERMQINGVPVPGEVLAELTGEVKEIADSMDDHPSQFELATAISMLWFLREKCDIVVLEVGMGGALDSTNVIDAPEVSVITNIGPEHTEYLGNTIAEIAAAKAGIIKTGSSCVCYDGPAEAVEVVRNTCIKKGVSFTLVDFSDVTPVNHSLSGQTFLWRGTTFELSLLGEHQLHNGAVVLETVDVLRQRGWKIEEEDVRVGLKTVVWPGRFEVLNRSPLFVLDGGHNPQCAQALADILRDYLPDEKFTFLMGVLADKDIPAMLEAAEPFARQFVCVTPDSPRALEGQKLAKLIEDRGFAAVSCEKIETGVKTSLETGDSVVAFGSLYMAGAVRSSFRGVYRSWLRGEKIRARDRLTDEAREKLSRCAVEHILECEAFQKAKTILIYRAIRGELKLEMLAQMAQKMGKEVAYPLCLENHEMIGLIPGEKDGWNKGYCGIPEPKREKSREVLPEELDFVVCPCTAFDEKCHRMGMGGGFYDRFLMKCSRAVVAGVGFEVQKAEEIPVECWDRDMDFIFTESRCISARI